LQLIYLAKQTYRSCVTLYLPDSVLLVEYTHPCHIPGIRRITVSPYMLLEDGSQGTRDGTSLQIHGTCAGGYPEMLTVIYTENFQIHRHPNEGPAMVTITQGQVTGQAYAWEGYCDFDKEKVLAHVPEIL